MRLDHLLSKEKETSSLFKVCYLFFNVLILYIEMSYGDIAQLARAPALQAGGQGFDSLYLHHANIKHSYNMKMFESLDFIASSARNIK